jgi:peptidoglycan hydrolase-like protein with peptidoglycan-binding domain
MPFLSAVLRWTPRGAIGFVVGAVAVITIFVNALFMQSGLHPAPLLKPPAFSDPIHRAPKAAAGAPAQPAPAPVTAKISHASRAPGEMIMDIQQELAHRGYYDGPVDGLYGPRTEGAIRDFERAASLTPSASLSEALLHAIMRSPVRRENVHPARTAVAGPSVSEGVIRPPPTPSLAQVLAVQRALSEFGYGQIRPTGTIDPDTQRAIAEFEHERNLPISGQLSERLIRELSAATRRTLH